MQSFMGVFIQWNGMVEWNSGMTTPTDHVLSRPIPTIFQDTAVFSSHGKQVVSAVLQKTSSI